MNKKILILGVDGYIGWNLAMHLGVRNDGLIIGVDDGTRRRLVAEWESDSLTPILPMEARIFAYENTFMRSNIKYLHFDLSKPRILNRILQEHKPDVIINLAQIPSAPYSMASADNAVYTTRNNVMINLELLWAMKKHCPDAHLIKMGTMGEYGTPNIDIPEGFFEVEFRGRKDVLPFPRQAGSFYHWAKVSESQHTAFACKIWKLRATDMMQGIVYGVTTEESEKNPNLLSRFDYDEAFGTVLNRFVVQAMVKHPLTVYGGGTQKRGLINIRDAVKCFELYIENPPKKGEYQVFNQLCEQQRDVNQLALAVKKAATRSGLRGIQIDRVKNPRIEAEKHYYNVDASKLKKLGLKKHDFFEEVERMFKDLAPWKHHINEKVLKPKTKWK